jgi:hypothetical protein
MSKENQSVNIREMLSKQKSAGSEFAEEIKEMETKKGPNEPLQVSPQTEVANNPDDVVSVRRLLQIAKKHSK